MDPHQGSDGLLSLAPDDVAELLSPPAFAWSPCSYTLTTTEHSWPPTMDARMLPPQMSVSMERLPIATASGWVWHKNHQLPRLNMLCVGGQSLPEGSACLMSAVTVDVLTHVARDVGLEGGTMQPLVNGACTFSSLTFKTTSYNLKGKPIHLMASLLRREGEQLCVAASLLSPPLVVDARKRQAKESKGAAAPSAAPAADGAADAGGETRLLPFAPAELERKLEKVDRKSARHEIDNSITGLRAYLSALNIRNKCKHPLFLVLRFSACVGLWYDAAHTGADPLRDDEAFCEMVRVLGMASLDGKATPPYGGVGIGYQATGSPVRLPPFVVAIKSSHEMQACTQRDCPVHLPSSLSLPHAQTLPGSYRELCDHQLVALRRTYCRLYCTHAQSVLAPWQTPRTPLLPPSIGGMGPPEVQPKTALCEPCGVHHPALPAKPSAAVSELLAKVREMTVETPGAMTPTEEGGPMGVLGDMGCPEREWEEGLMLLAQTMALHCRTRSAEEIAAFMMGDGSAHTSKRPSNTNDHASAGVDRASAGLDRASAGLEEMLSVEAVPAMSYSHGHDHAVVPCQLPVQPVAMLVSSSPTPSTPPADCVDGFFAHSHQHHLQR